MSVNVRVAVLLLPLMASYAQAKNLPAPAEKVPVPVACNVAASVQILSAASAYEIDPTAEVVTGEIAILRVSGSWTGYSGSGVVWVDSGIQAAAVSTPFVKFFVVSGQAHGVLLTVGPAPYRCTATATTAVQ